MGKQALAWILALVLLTAALPLSAAAEEAPSSRLSEHLVAHWNFEGDTLEERLSDKATGGTVEDMLKEYYPGKEEGGFSPIVVEAGTAFIPHDEGVYLAADNSADLCGMTEYTVFARFCMSGTPNAFMDFIFKNGFLRMYINNAGDAGAGDYALEFRQNGSATYAFTDPAEVSVRQNQMISLAVTARMEGRDATVVVYVSTDGVSYTATEPVTLRALPQDYFGAASSLTENSPFVLGKATPNASDRRVDFTMEDVRLYDTALTSEEVSSIRFPPSGEEPGSEILLASWSFDELRGDTAVDSVSGRKAVLSNASFTQGIQGNGVRLDAARNGAIDFGRRGLTDMIDGKQAFSMSLWILPSYYLGRQTMRLLTLGADEDGKPLLDIHWAKNNAVERPGISVSVRGVHSDAEAIYSAQYTLPESAIPNLGYMATDTSKTLGVWQLLTVTVDAATRELRVFINTEQVISARVAFREEYFSAGDGTLMSDSIGYSEAAAGVMAFNGVVDEFRIYEGVLSEKQIAAMVEGTPDATSPTADQRLVDALVKRMGNAAALYRGSSNALLRGYTVKLDPADYTLGTIFRRGKVYIPEAFALSYFELDAVPADDDGYVELNALCDQQGYTLYYSFSEKLAIITPADVAGFSGDDELSEGYTNLQYRNRMIAFFNNPMQPEPENNTEQSRTVVYTSEELGQYVYSPSICVLDEVLYASCDIKSEYTLVFRSRDQGETWEQIGKIDGLRCATLFAYEGNLYLLGLFITTAKDSMGICGTRSLTDGAVVWSAVSTIHCDFIEKSGHCTPSPVLFANGRIYKAYEDSNVWAEEGGSMGAKKAFVLSCDLNDNLLNGSNWISSNYITITSDWVKEQIGSTTCAHHGTPALEGNMVQGPDGKIYNILRLNCEPQNGYAIRLELSADGTTLSYPEEYPVIGFPGGENKFSIRYDARSGYYLSLVNNNTAGWWPMQRNVLSLSVSKDLIHWEVVETILVDRTMLNFDVSMALHGFQYVDWCIEGDDIVFVVRETMGESQIFHNGYEMTFYRISDYRSLFSEQEPPQTGGDDVTGEPAQTEPISGEEGDAGRSDGGCSSTFSAGSGGAVLLLLVFFALLLRRKERICKISPD